MENNKIVLLHWIGRFGNRMFQYAFGCCYAKQFNCTFYIPSSWEGTVLFTQPEYCKIIPDDELRLHINQSYADESYRKTHFLKYKERTGDAVEYINFNNPSHIGKTNIAFDDLNCMYYKHCFKIYNNDIIKEIYTFNHVILQSDIYKWFEDRNNTYNVAHIRRGDISSNNFNGHHSMVSKESYLTQIELLSLDNIVWVSDDNKEKTVNIWHNKSPGHKWSYPCGESQCKDIFFDFLPDFLLILFARTIIRGNSSFSWWASYLSNAKVYSPVINVKPVEVKNKYYKMDTTYVEGNHPHFMGNISEGEFNDIIF